MDKNTLQNALNEFSQGTTDNIDSIMIKDATGKQYWMKKADLASVLGELLKKETFALELSKLSGYNCQFVTFKQNEEQKLPEKCTGLVSIGYSPFQFNKVILIKTDRTIESISEPWWNGSISVRIDDDGEVYLRQTSWPSMRLRIACL